MGRRFGKRPRKNNKAARAQKLRWLKTKVLNSVRNEPRVFDEIPEVHDTDYEEPSLTLESKSSEVFDILESDASNVETLWRKNSNWASKTYDAQHFINKRPVPVREIGTISSDECERINCYPLSIEKELESPITGNRIVELDYVLKQALHLQFNHSKICEGQLQIMKERRIGKGLVSTVVFNCSRCSGIFELNTENPDKPTSTINSGAVWGTLATGSTYGHLEEFLSCMDVPSMPNGMFYNLESKLGTEWKSSLWHSMTTAGEREKEYAISEGHMCLDGTPYITVYVDGSWSKRSYGTNFNSLSGMVGIIGRHTGELLFAAVRNKFCSVCQRAESQEKNPEPHVCYKNWKESAPAMEPDMVVEGFNLSQSMHGVKYCKFVADGDSSVFAKIKQNVTYGHEVKKIECTNHALKNYGKHLYKIKADTTIDLKGRKLLKKSTIQLLTKRAKCSIYEHSKGDNKAIASLKEDLQNGVHHVFGDHLKCRIGICNNVGEQEESKISELKSTSIYNHLYGAVNLLVRKAHLLIENENNNRAERLMNIVSRFNMGKRLNLIQRGSYERRVFLSGLRYNKSHGWHSSPWKRATGRSPGQHFKKYMQKMFQHSRRSNIRRKLFPKNKIKDNNKHKIINTDYGPNAEQPEEDPETISLECSRVLESLQVTVVERDNIQKDSVGQFGNEFYESQRRLRLTASLFGRVVKRRPHTSCHGLVKSCLVQSHFQTDATEYGIAKEIVAVKLLEEKIKKKVKKSGLWVDLQYGFLGASPDGLIEDDSIVEVKCIYFKSEVQVNNMEEVIQLRKSQICLQRKDDTIQLKRNHSYYYQIQGQLNITNTSKCYFVVYVNDKIDLYVEEIYRDEDFWQNKMLPELIKFYNECVAPEIIRNNIGRGKKCLDPPYIENAIKLFNDRKKQTIEKVGPSELPTSENVEAGPSGIPRY